MTKPLLGLLSLLPGAALVFAASCGGRAFENNAMAGAGGLGAGSSAGASSGGSASGGTTGLAGTTSVAGSSSKAGSGNSGGSVGNGGNGGAAVTACKSNSECEVVPASCCSCGLGPISNYTAINSAYSAQYNMRCGDTGCGCPASLLNPNDPTLYYVATCSAGQCQVVDLAATPVTACTSTSDCTLRTGAACCSGCGGQPVAINKNEESDLEQIVCGSEPVACAACAPSFSGYSASCSAGRCSVVLTPCTTEHPCPL